MQEWDDSGEVRLLSRALRAATAHFVSFVEMTFLEYEALGPRQEKVRVIWSCGFIYSFPGGIDIFWVPCRCQALCQPLGTDMPPFLEHLGADHRGRERSEERTVVSEAEGSQEKLPGGEICFEEWWGSLDR